MSPARWQQLQAILQRALATPEAQRADLVDILCSRDAVLKVEVQAFLKHINVVPEELSPAPNSAWLDSSLR